MVLPYIPTFLNEDTQWKYLAGMLEEKVDKETFDRIILAYQRLPEHIQKSKQTPKSHIPLKMTAAPNSICIKILNLI
jgi:hypothetical protein